MNSEVGKSSLTLHDVYWHEQSVRRELDPAEVVCAGSLEDPVAAEFTAHKYKNLESLLSRLGKAFSQCLTSHDTVQAHPLFGLQNPGVGPSAQEQLRRRLQSWDGALERLERTLGHFSSAFNCTVAATIKDISAFTTAVFSLPEIPPNADLALLARIRGEKERAGLAQTVSLTRLIVDSRAALTESFSGLDAVLLDTREMFARARRLRSSWESLSLADIELRDLPDAIGKKEQEIATIGSAVMIFDQIAATTGVELPLTGRTLTELVEATQLIRTTAPEVLATRSAPLYTADAHAMLTRRSAEASKLLPESVRLSEEARLSFRGQS